MINIITGLLFDPCNPFGIGFIRVPIENNWKKRKFDIYMKDKTINHLYY